MLSGIAGSSVGTLTGGSKAWTRIQQTVACIILALAVEPFRIKLEVMARFVRLPGKLDSEEARGHGTISLPEPLQSLFTRRLGKTKTFLVRIKRIKKV